MPPRVEPVNQYMWFKKVTKNMNQSLSCLLYTSGFAALEHIAEFMDGKAPVQLMLKVQKESHMVEMVYVVMGCFAFQTVIPLKHGKMENVTLTI